jgi:hypothetical protein
MNNNKKTNQTKTKQKNPIKLNVKVAAILSLEEMVIRGIPGLTVKYKVYFRFVNTSKEFLLPKTDLHYSCIHTTKFYG